MKERNGGRAGRPEAKEAPRGIEKLATHIVGLDDITMGGFPKGRSTLLSGSSGSCKTVLSMQFLVGGILNSDGGGVFVTCEETPADIARNFSSFDWDIPEMEREGRLRIVDLSPEPERRTMIRGEFDFSGMMARIEHAVREVGATRVVIDSIGSLFNRFPDEGKVREELFRVSAGLKLLGVTTLLTGERTAEYGQVSRHGVEEFVADNVIILRNILSEEKVRRTIQILKFRGTDHNKGEFPFTVSEKGVEIMALSAMELSMKSSDTRIGSGNPELDRMCGGGFFRDSIILASGATGTGKTLLVTSFMERGCREGERCLIFAFEESEQQLLRNAIGWSMDFRKWQKEGRLKIVCDYPEVVGLTDHLLKIKREIEAFRPDRIALDSLSALERVDSGKGFREFVVGLTSFIKRRQIAGLFTAVTPTLMGGSSVTEQHISTITDSIILMRYVELMGCMNRGLTVLKMRGSWHDKEIRQYDITGEGMEIGKAFSNVAGIMAGNPTQMLRGEVQDMTDMFE